MMNEDNLNLGLKQDNPNIPNNTEVPSVPNQNYFQQSPTETVPQVAPVQPQTTQDSGVKPPKNNKKILIIAIISIVVILLGVIGFFLINNSNKSKSNLDNSAAESESSTVSFADAADKQYIEDSNKQYGIRFDNQVILTASVPIDRASTNPQEYDGVAVIAIDVSECNHIDIRSESTLTCFLNKDESDYYYVVASSNDLSAYDNFREIARNYKEQSKPYLISKGIAYDDIEVYTAVYKTGILHAYFGHLGVSGQYSPYFFITFNKNDKTNKLFDDKSVIDAYYRKMSIISVPKPVIN